MVEQEELFSKEQLKNKRFVKGTPLYHFASRYARYFALSLGCAHLTFIGITYYSNVSEEFLTAGLKQIEQEAIRHGIYDKTSEDTEMRLQQIKEDLQSSTAYSIYSDATEYIKKLQERIRRNSSAVETNTPASSPVANKEPSTTVSTPVTEASK